MTYRIRDGAAIDQHGNVAIEIGDYTLVDGERCKVVGLIAPNYPPNVYQGGVIVMLNNGFHVSVDDCTDIRKSEVE